MTRSTEMYDLSLDQSAELIAKSGHLVTYLLQGHTGIGKSALLGGIGKMLPTHKQVYFDCTTKEAGDVIMPKMKMEGDNDFFRSVTHEELGAHLAGPIVLMVDEWGKANPSVKNALNRTMYERKVGPYTLHPDSVVFATTNIASEGLGDTMMAHHANRITVVRVRKPDHMEWLAWAIENQLDPAMMGWVRETPQLFQSFEDVKSPEDNPYIYHPKDPARLQFVTGRSLEKGSNIIKATRGMDEMITTSALIGTIGARGAMDLMAFVTLAHEMPTQASIIDNPKTAKIPASASAVCMVVFRALATIEAKWLDNWMIYLERLDAEAQGLFVNGVRGQKYSKMPMVMGNRRFSDWVGRNSHLFGTDKV
jgi:hypothetical protein